MCVLRCLELCFFFLIFFSIIDRRLGVCMYVCVSSRSIDRLTMLQCSLAIPLSSTSCLSHTSAATLSVPFYNYYYYYCVSRVLSAVFFSFPLLTLCCVHVCLHSLCFFLLVFFFCSSSPLPVQCFEHVFALLPLSDPLEPFLIYAYNKLSFAVSIKIAHTHVHTLRCTQASLSLRHLDVCVCVFACGERRRCPLYLCVFLLPCAGWLRTTKRFTASLVTHLTETAHLPRSLTTGRPATNPVRTLKLIHFSLSFSFTRPSAH